MPDEAAAPAAELVKLLERAGSTGTVEIRSHRLGWNRLTTRLGTVQADRAGSHPEAHWGIEGIEARAASHVDGTSRASSPDFDGSTIAHAFRPPPSVAALKRRSSSIGPP